MFHASRKATATAALSPSTARKRQNMLSSEDAIKRLKGWKETKSPLSVRAVENTGRSVHVDLGAVVEVEDELVIADIEGREALRVTLSPNKVTFSDECDEIDPHLRTIPSTSILVISSKEDKSQLVLVEYGALLLADRGDDWTPEAT